MDFTINVGQKREVGTIATWKFTPLKVGDLTIDVDS